MASKANARKTSRDKKRRSGRAPTKVTVTFRHVEPSPAVQQYAERKLGHIAKFVNRPTEAHLILTVDKYRQWGEVTVKAGRLTINAQDETKDLYSVIDLLSGKVERQLKRHLEKIKGKKSRTPSTGEMLSASEEPVA